MAKEMTDKQQPEAPERAELSRSMLYQFVRFNHDPRQVYLVTDVTDDCMLELEGISGLFAPHLFQRVQKDENYDNA